MIVCTTLRWLVSEGDTDTYVSVFCVVLTVEFELELELEGQKWNDIMKIEIWRDESRLD